MTPFREKMKTLLIPKEVAMNVLTKLTCLLGMHQGEWITGGSSGCWQRYICRYCGVIEQRERHVWSEPYVGVYFEDGSCETRVTYLHCGQTESTGTKHEGWISPWYPYCKRCDEDLSVDVGDFGD